jgi:hypothetical protein
MLIIMLVLRNLEKLRSLTLLSSARLYRSVRSKQTDHLGAPLRQSSPAG